MDNEQQPQTEVQSQDSELENDDMFGKEETVKPKPEYKTENNDGPKPLPAFEATEVDQDTFNRFTRDYLVYGEAIPEAVMDKLNILLARIHSKHFTLRAAMNRDNPLEELAIKSTDKKEFYFPFKFKDIDSNYRVKVNKVDYKAISIGMTVKLNAFRKYTSDKFNAMKDIGKLFTGRDVHQVLGEDLNTPVKFMLIYTPKGEEAGDRIDFETAGNAVMLLLLAKSFSIPVYNIANEESLVKLMAYLDTLE